jgi:hypothetical protein
MAAHSIMVAVAVGGACSSQVPGKVRAHTQKLTFTDLIAFTKRFPSRPLRALFMVVVCMFVFALSVLVQMPSLAASWIYPYKISSSPDMFLTLHRATTTVSDGVTQEIHQEGTYLSA